MKASEWIRDALQELGVAAAEQPITSDPFQTGVRYANRLMYSFDNLGLGYTVINSANDEVTIPPYAEEWAVTALAVRMSPQFGPAQSFMELKANERTAYLQMLKHIDLDISACYPSILPVGSGNYCGNNGPTFYPANENVILDEQGNNILLEQ